MLRAGWDWTCARKNYYIPIHSSSSYSSAAFSDCLFFWFLRRDSLVAFGKLRTTRLALAFAADALAIGAMFGFFYGLSKMPLVNALTLGFTAPLMVTALSVPFLGEHVGWRRWVAVIVGFIGTMIMLRPGSGEFTLASLAILIAAFCYACQAITARHLATESDIIAGRLRRRGSADMLATFLIDGDSWITPNMNGWLLMGLAGICSAIAWIGFINGYRGSSPAILAPFEYTALIGGAIAGYLIWDEVPDRWVVIGAATIIASGLYVVYREIGLKGQADSDQKKRASRPVFLLTSESASLHIASHQARDLRRCNL